MLRKPVMNMLKPNHLSHSYFPSLKQILFAAFISLLLTTNTLTLSLSLTHSLTLSLSNCFLSGRICIAECKYILGFKHNGLSIARSFDRSGVCCAFNS